MGPRSLAAPPYPAERDHRARVVPAVTTALLSVLGPAALLLGALSGVATSPKLSASLEQGGAPIAAVPTTARRR